MNPAPSASQNYATLAPFSHPVNDMTASTDAIDSDEDQVIKTNHNVNKMQV